MKIATTSSFEYRHISDFSSRVFSRLGFLLLTGLMLFCVLLARPPRVSAQESAADKAKREEIQRRNAEIEKQNAQITANNRIVQRTFTAPGLAANLRSYIR